MRQRLICRFCLIIACGAHGAGSIDAEESNRDQAKNQIVVSPQGPRDGGDFGPHTPGTKTSGVQEALLAAKSQAKDVYLAGGSWTADKAQPVVYNLHETLHVPWMQNFRLDSGHCVLNYTPKTGDAVVFDSQMSCAYRFGLIVSMADGAVVRMQPSTAGPDRFKVITSSEFVFNALVGGGGAWPGGEPHANELDRSREWKGVGLWLDGAKGPIDANKITVVETVGCNIGLLATGAVSRNTVEEVNVHLCRNHVQIGSEGDALPNDNRIEAFMDCQGIDPTSGARIFRARNLLTLSTRQTEKSADLVFERSRRGQRRDCALGDSPHGQFHGAHQSCNCVGNFGDHRNAADASQRCGVRECLRHPRRSAHRRAGASAQMGRARGWGRLDRVSRRAALRAIAGAQSGRERAI